VVGTKVERIVRSFEDLDVYQKLVKLHLEVNGITLSFPAYELYELGSQLRRSSNSIPANVAEGWNNKHLNSYLECLNRALGELRETKHHISIAFKKGHITRETLEDLVGRYDECGRMLRGLEQALEKSRAASSSQVRTR
jgi:four helix bundle protein